MVGDVGSPNSDQVARLRRQAQVIRRDILTMIHAARSGHPGGSLSAADIVTALYFQVLRLDPAHPDWTERDRFILSKGHACPVWYACLAERGYFPVEELLTLRALGGRLQGHPDMRKTPGIDMTTGSLGQGLSAGVGMALGLRLARLDARVYVMLGDGELNEGQIWEAALSAAKFRLANLTAIVDYNHLQLDGPCEAVMPIEPLAAKWRAFGWHALEIDGHDMAAILRAFDAAKAHTEAPTVLIATTIKGRGVSFMEGDPDWHGRAPNDREYAAAMAELQTEGGLP